MVWPLENLPSACVWEGKGKVGAGASQAVALEAVGLDSAGPSPTRREPNR